MLVNHLLDFTLHETRNRNTEGIRNLNERTYRRISPSKFEVGQITPLHRRALSKLLLGPTLFEPQEFDPPGQQPQDLGLR